MSELLGCTERFQSSKEEFKHFRIDTICYKAVNLYFPVFVMLCSDCCCYLNTTGGYEILFLLSALDNCVTAAVCVKQECANPLSTVQQIIL